MLKLHTPKDMFVPIAPFAKAIEAVVPKRLPFDRDWLIEVEAIAAA